VRCSFITREKKGHEHREPKTALKLAHAEDELCLAEGSDIRCLQLQLDDALANKRAVTRRRGGLRHETAHPVPAKTPVKSTSCTLWVRERDGGGAAAAASETHDLPDFQLVEEADTPMMLCNMYILYIGFVSIGISNSCGC
jgi:hypothetical protein